MKKKIPTNKACNDDIDESKFTMKLSYDSENLQKITQIEKVSFEMNTICDENPMFFNDDTSGAAPAS